MVVAAAGALSVATAASATAATWTPPESAHAEPAHAGTAGGAHPTAAQRLSLADELAQPQAATQQTSATQQAGATLAQQATQQTGATLVQHAYQLRAAQTQAAAARLIAAQRAAAKAAAAKAAAARAARDRAAATRSARPQSAVTTAVSGTPQQIAKAMLASFGWSAGQFSCLEPLWAHESGWSVTAYNPSSGAYGIPQALPGAKMASAGPNWQTSATTQVRWGLEYIRSTYGSPCGAWDHEQATGWY